MAGKMVCAEDIPISAALVATIPITLNVCSKYERKDSPELTRCVAASTIDD
jgi:hypothetical protein